MKITAPRMSGWALVAAILAGGVAFVAPENGPVLLYKLSLVTLAAVLGYMLDRALFPYSRPHEAIEGECGQIAAAAMIRRAIVVAAAILGVTLGL